MLNIDHMNKTMLQITYNITLNLITLNREIYDGQVSHNHFHQIRCGIDQCDFSIESTDILAIDIYRGSKYPWVQL